MEQVLIGHAKVQDGRNRAMHVRQYAEASPIDGTMQAVPAELALCKRIGAILNHHYKGHPWMIEVNFVQGMAKIGIPVLLGNWTYNIRLDEIVNDADLRSSVLRGGGELLERFGIPRNTIDVASYLAALGSIPMIGNFRARDRKLIPGG